MNAPTRFPRFTIAQFADHESLPSLPEVALKLMEVSDQEQPNYAEIASIIKADPAISGKILKVTNSALFAFCTKIDSIEEALPKLGLNFIRTIILGFHLAQTGQYHIDQTELIKQHWRSSLTQAVFAELIAERIGAKTPESYFLAGLLQDIGILAMLSLAPDEYSQHVLERSQFPEVVTAERSYFGFSHVDVTSAIIKRWGMEKSFKDALIHHHARIIPAVETRHPQMIVVLQAANRGAQMLFAHRNSGLPLKQAVQQWASFLNTKFGLLPQQAETIIDEIQRRVDQYCAIFNFDIGIEVCADDVIRQAKDRLHRIAFEMLEKNISGKSERSDLIYQDSLSGLLNRRYLDENLSALVSKAGKEKQPLGLIFIDVDKFKQINDNFGHAVGDQALESVANWIKLSIRGNDLAVRMGGDEFVIIFQNITTEIFLVIIERILNGPPQIKLEVGDSIEIKLSLGCIHVVPNSKTRIDPNELLDQADQLMYRVKKQGGGNFIFESFRG